VLFQDPEAFLAEVEEIAALGATRLMAHWRALEPDQVDEKARNDLVSAADLAPEEAIMGAIRPLHGIPQFAISIGVAVEGRIDFGVILDPCKNDLFSAARGRGARWNGAKCCVSEREALPGALLATGFPFKAHRLLDPYLAIFRDVFLRCKAIRRPGAAALDLAYTACGLFDGFFEFQLSAWDIAAGSVLVEEAGGVITGMDGGSDYLESGNVVCGPPGVHRELLEVVSSHRDEWQKNL
jgi:myo-inositol-1(or 4)-monophosphatase